MASAYAFHLAESQAFVDGNKRAGLAAAYAFLALNGIPFKVTLDRAAAAKTLGAARVSKRTWKRQYLIERSKDRWESAP